MQTLQSDLYLTPLSARDASKPLGNVHWIAQNGTYLAYWQIHFRFILCFT